MTLFVAGLSYQTAPVELREQLAVNPSHLIRRAHQLKLSGELDEIVLLSTCSRVEIYGTTPQVPAHVDSLFQLLCEEPCEFHNHVYVHEGLEALRHLFHVAAGLDSMVLGESEITGQVKHAYDAAHAAGLTGAMSIGGAAVELTERIFRHDLSKQSVMIIGAGQMGEACLRHLAKKGARSMVVSNRSFDRAVDLANEFGGRAVRFEDCLPAMADADIVVASTGCPKTLLYRADIELAMQTRRNRPLILIDISVPRNVAPDVQQLDNVYLYNIDDLNAIVCENIRHREQELASCNQLIEARAATLMEKLDFRNVQRHERGLEFQPN